MKKSTTPLNLHNLISLCLIVAIFMTTSMVALAAPGRALTGEIIISGTDNGSESAVTLNDEPISSGRTFMSSGTIATSATRSATVNFGKMGFVTLSPGSTISLTVVENNITGNLSAGDIRVLGNEGVAVSIQTADNVVTKDPASAASFSVSVRSGKTVAAAERGNVAMDSGNTPVAAQTTADDDDRDWLPILIYIGIVSVAVTYILIKNNRDDDLTPPILSGTV